jgi:hypothetical protein
MSKSVRITLNQISGVANAYYDMLDQDQTYIFQQVYGASLSNGISYNLHYVKQSNIFCAINIISIYNS